MKQTFNILAAQLRISAMGAMQYRFDFLFDAVSEILWAITAVLPLFAVFEHTKTMGGWTLGESLVVAGFFTVVEGVLEGLIQPSLLDTVDRIRKGTFDFVLLRPADAQLLSSFSKIQPWRGINALTGSILVAVGFHTAGIHFSIAAFGLSLVFLALGLSVLYSFYLAATSIAFYVVRVDNLTHFISAVFDAARWPSSVFRGAVRIVLTYVIPLTIMTTFPAEALLGRSMVDKLPVAVGLSVVFLSGSRALWRRAIRSYTSASS